MSINNRRQYYPLIVIGSGPAGYTAALYARRANINLALITGIEPGGQLMTTTAVDNWPGGSENLQGPDLMNAMEDHLKRYNTKIISDQIIQANIQKSPLLHLEGENSQYGCDALIIATGASARYLGLTSEKQYRGKGVSACATCDGFFYKNKSVAVIGGGNTAVEEALYLSNIASEVTLIHRRDQLRAEKMLAQRLIEKSQKGNIRILWNTVLKEVLGNKQSVTALRLENVHSKVMSSINTDGLFIAIGHTPNTEIFKGQLKMNDQGYITTLGGSNGNATTTNIPGVFAAGDVADSIYRQAITAAGTGCMAALDAEKYLDSVNSVEKNN